MSDIITNVTLIKKEWWQQERDGMWYVHIPCDCTEKDDVILDFSNTPQEFIDANKADLDALNNGYTINGECVITADHKINCDIPVEVKLAKVMPGRIMYTRDEATGEFKAEWVPDNPTLTLDMLSLMGGGGFNSSQLQDLIPEPKKEIII